MQTERGGPELELNGARSKDGAMIIIIMTHVCCSNLPRPLQKKKRNTIIDGFGVLLINHNIQL